MVDITPYYWVKEECEPCDEPIIKGNTTEFKVKYLTKDEVTLIAKKVPKILGDDLIKGFKRVNYVLVEQKNLLQLSLYRTQKTLVLKNDNLN